MLVKSQPDFGFVRLVDRYFVGPFGTALSTFGVRLSFQRLVTYSKSELTLPTTYRLLFKFPYRLALYTIDPGFTTSLSPPQMSQDEDQLELSRLYYIVGDLSVYRTRNSESTRAGRRQESGMQSTERENELLRQTKSIDYHCAGIEMQKHGIRNEVGFFW